jgi:hypothetical protein
MAEPFLPGLHNEFEIGATFWCDGNLWRCTDIGTRVIVTIRLDRVEVGTATPELRRTPGNAEAQPKAGSKHRFYSSPR